MTSSLISLGRGQPPKATAVKEAQGTLKKSRRNKSEPTCVAIKVPSPPRHLSSIEKKVWKRLARIVDPLKIVAASDLEAFALMVTSFAIVEQARASLFDRETNPDLSMTYEELTDTDRIARTKKRPEIEVIAQHKKLALFELSRFGLTPADRQRVNAIGETAGSDPLSEFDR